MINQISNKVLYYSKAYHRILRYTGKSRFCHSTGVTLYRFLDSVDAVIELSASEIRKDLEVYEDARRRA